MTREEKREYLDRLRQNEGAGLLGMELTTYQKAMEGVDAARKAREELQRLLTTARQFEQTIQQYDGRVAACFDLLFGAEEERRTAPPAVDVAEQVATEQLAQAFGDPSVEANA